MAKILIVEDEPDMVLGLKDNFEFEGYEVLTAADGAAGLERARTQKPDLVILDIIGKRTFMQLFKDAYFSGARGILAVFDRTRKATLNELPAWITGVRETVGQIPVVVLANKDDLKERHETRDDDITRILEPLDTTVMRTSAKTGENVERAFQQLARTIVLAPA